MQESEIFAAYKALKVKQKQYLVITLFCHQLIDGEFVATGVQHTDFRIVGGEEGYKAVCIAVLDDQQFACTGSINGGIAVIAVQEQSVLVSCISFF